MMTGFVEGIFLAPEAGAKATGAKAANALEGCGLEGDRYCSGTGHWSRFVRVCEVTFIAAEDLHNIERETNVGVKNGEHRYQPRPAHLFRLHAHSVEKQDEREREDGYRLQGRILGTEREVPEAPLSDQEAQPQEDDRERDGSALHEA